MSTSLSRSSPTFSSSAASRSGADAAQRRSSSCPTSSCLLVRRCWRRTASMARFFAVAVSHAPGLSGMPDSGQRSSAATRASCANSSARPTSRTIRATAAITLADSMRKTASIWRCAAEGVTKPHQTIGALRRKRNQRRCCCSIFLRSWSSCSRTLPVGSTGAKSAISNTCRISTSPSWNGARLSHSIASSFDFTCQSQKPATSSFVSANGPSMTVFLFPSNRTRAPLELAWRPSPASITPAFTSSSLNFPIAVRIFSSGSTPASESLFAFTITMNRIVVSGGSSRGFPYLGFYQGDERRRGGSTRPRNFLEDSCSIEQLKHLTPHLLATESQLEQIARHEAAPPDQQLDPVGAWVPRPCRGGDPRLPPRRLPGRLRSLRAVRSRRVHGQGTGPLPADGLRPAHRGRQLRRLRRDLRRRREHLPPAEGVAGSRSGRTDPPPRPCGNALRRLERRIDRGWPLFEDDQGHADRAAPVVRCAGARRLPDQPALPRSRSFVEAHGRDPGGADPPVPRGERHTGRRAAGRRVGAGGRSFGGPRRDDRSARVSQGPSAGGEARRRRRPRGLRWRSCSPARTWHRS